MLDVSTENHDCIVDADCLTTLPRIPSWWHVLNEGVVHLGPGQGFQQPLNSWMPLQIPDRNNKLRGFGRRRTILLHRACWDGKGNCLYLFFKFQSQRTYEEKIRNKLNNCTQLQLHTLVTRNLCFWKLCPDLVPSFLGRSYLWGIGSCPGHLAVNVRWCVGRTWVWCLCLEQGRSKLGNSLNFELQVWGWRSFFDILQRINKHMIPWAVFQARWRVRSARWRLLRVRCRWVL